MINEILKMYKELKLGGNEICKTCKIENIKVKSGISRPISPWHIGKRFKEAMMIIKDLMSLMQQYLGKRHC
jgi:hypothetical protein